MTAAALPNPSQPTPSRSAMPAWFDTSGPHLLGQHCTGCGAVFFPPTSDFCQNPSCDNDTFEIRPMSTRGRVWSWTTNHYRPPAPAVSPDPFVPYTVVAVELAAEAMVVLGQLSGASPALSVGDEVELRSERLLVDDTGEQMVWRWTKTTTEVGS